MAIEYRTAAAEDIARMVDSRLETLRAVNHLAEDYTFSEDYIAASRKYFLEGDQITVLALDGEQFLRYDGEAKVVKDDALLDKVREIMPDIMGLYDQNGWEMGLFCLNGGHAEIRGPFDVIEEFDV